jgi:integrase
MSKVPKYRKHSTRNLGFVEVNGKRFYLPGKYNSHESLSAYADFIKKIATKTNSASLHSLDLRATRGDDVPISYLVAKFLDYAQKSYVKNGRSTRNYERYRDYILPPLVELYSEIPTRLFGPIDLRNIRDKYIERGLCRNEVNDRTTRLKFVFSWGVGEELVPESVAGALRYVKGLEKGKTTARETEPITSVSNTIIEKTLPFLPVIVADMVLLQRELGCRPSEVCNIRWCDIDQSDNIWIYEPYEHKTEHRNKKRYIAIRKNGQTILEQYRHRPVTEFIFSPKETIRIMDENKKNKKKKSKRLIQCNGKYSTQSYEKAIKRAAKRAGVEHWAPNRIRHRFATDTDFNLDKETARILLGHSRESTTDGYIDQDKEKIRKAARLLGD